MIPTPARERGRAGRAQEEPVGFVIKFTRIGDATQVRDLEVPICNAEELTDRVLRHVRPRLLVMTDPPGPIEVWCDPAAGVGYIKAGDRPAGAFTIQARGGPA
jgi:hypothetical protein